jgi:creatinine amidohydrolase/Fe(II)-dependent formamide hydrolase-like protein
MFRRFRRLTAAGSMGKPSKATADKGKRILKLVTGEVVKLVKDLSKWPELPPLKPPS